MTAFSSLFPFFFFLDLGLKVDGEYGERRSHVLVLHQNVGGHVQMGGSEIPDGLDTPGNQQVGDTLGALGGDGDG